MLARAHLNSKTHEVLMRLRCLELRPQERPVYVRNVSVLAPVESEPWTLLWGSKRSQVSAQAVRKDSRPSVCQDSRRNRPTIYMSNARHRWKRRRRRCRRCIKGRSLEPAIRILAAKQAGAIIGPQPVRPNVEGTVDAGTDLAVVTHPIPATEPCLACPQQP